MSEARDNRLLLCTAILVALILVGACDKPQALGDPNAVIVATPEAAWADLEEQIEAALEPRAFTVRDERIFRVTHVDPTGPQWDDFRRFQQVLVIGEPSDQWIAETLEHADEPLPELPAIVEARNVWARGQRVLALVVPPGAPATTVSPLLPRLGERLLQDYQQFVLRRMYASGVDTVQVSGEGQQSGAHLVIPSVYRLEKPDPNTFLLINDQPDPAKLQRVVLVTTRPSGEVDLAPQAILDWREERAARYYQPPQQTERERVEQTQAGAGALQVQGVWSTPPGGWPAAGPFLARAVECPDGRTYLLDAWVYAPGREKYEFLFQLDTILENFACQAQQGS